MADAAEAMTSPREPDAAPRKPRKKKKRRSAKPVGVDGTPAVSGPSQTSSTPGAAAAPVKRRKKKKKPRPPADGVQEKTGSGPPGKTPRKRKKKKKKRPVVAAVVELPQEEKQAIPVEVEPVVVPPEPPVVVVPAENLTAGADKEDLWAKLNKAKQGSDQRRNSVALSDSQADDLVSSFLEAPAPMSQADILRKQLLDRESSFAQNEDEDEDEEAPDDVAEAPRLDYLEMQELLQDYSKALMVLDRIVIATRARLLKATELSTTAVDIIRNTPQCAGPPLARLKRDVLFINAKPYEDMARDAWREEQPTLIGGLERRKYQMLGFNTPTVARKNTSGAARKRSSTAGPAPAPRVVYAAPGGDDVASAPRSNPAMEHLEESARPRSRTSEVLSRLSSVMGSSDDVVESPILRRLRDE